MFFPTVASEAASIDKLIHNKSEGVADDAQDGNTNEAALPSCTPPLLLFSGTSPEICIHKQRASESQAAAAAAVAEAAAAAVAAADAAAADVISLSLRCCCAR